MCECTVLDRMLLPGGGSILADEAWAILETKPTGRLNSGPSVSG